MIIGAVGLGFTYNGLIINKYLDKTSIQKRTSHTILLDLDVNGKYYVFIIVLLVTYVVCFLMKMFVRK
jgi:hypothetical protein